ncbi:hypothetical protein CLOM_g9030 [Closterium sp. NIES-68]|nr:hypothetical protein CLOM_g9030 [Closterium sp. NIES-68]GJP59286.1 hypothetical protein CLOP_g10182 [Closterium sp. NIES-67]
MPAFAAVCGLTLVISSLLVVCSHARDPSSSRLPADRSFEASNSSLVPHWASGEGEGNEGARVDIGKQIPHRRSIPTAASPEGGESAARPSARAAISSYDGSRLAGGEVPEWVAGDILHYIKEGLDELLGEGGGDGAPGGGAGDWDSFLGGWRDEHGIGSGEWRGAGGKKGCGKWRQESGAATRAISSRSRSSSSGIRDTDCSRDFGGRTTAESMVRRRSLRKKPLVPDLIVAQDGSGNVTNLEDAVQIIDSEKKRKSWFIVLLKPGTYVGNVEVKSRNVVLAGSGAWRTVITGNRSNGDGYDTWDTASFVASGDNFVTAGIRYENKAGPDMEAGVAFRASGDRTLVYRCIFAAFQDTVNAHRGRQYYRNCAIFGHVDFIFGRHGAAVFDRCRITPIQRPGKSSPATIATHGGDSPSKREGGFVFYRCWIASAPRGVKAYLGRPWRAHARVVYMLSYLSDAILPEGWVPWPGEDFGSKLFLGEYRNVGPGAGTSERVSWARPGLLDETDAASYMPDVFIRARRWVRRTPLDIKYP